MNKGAFVVATDLEVSTISDRLLTLGISVEKCDQVRMQTLDVLNSVEVSEFAELVGDDVDGVVNASYPRNREYGKHFFDVIRTHFSRHPLGS